METPAQGPHTRRWCVETVEDKLYTIEGDPASLVHGTLRVPGVESLNIIGLAQRPYVPFTIEELSGNVLLASRDWPTNGTSVRGVEFGRVRRVYELRYEHDCRQ
jgi:hypothetical protein